MEEKVDIPLPAGEESTAVAIDTLENGYVVSVSHPNGLRRFYARELSMINFTHTPQQLELFDNFGVPTEAALQE